MATTFDWNCTKWADCTCSKERECQCGESCGCGSVLIADVTKAMETECPLADCSCGNTCKCGKGNCNMGGTIDRTQEQWIEFVKARAAESS